MGALAPVSDETDETSSHTESSFIMILGEKELTIAHLKALRFTWRKDALHNRLEHSGAFVSYRRIRWEAEQSRKLSAARTREPKRTQIIANNDWIP